MIKEITQGGIPPTPRPIRQKRPESAFARREMQAFLDSGYDVAEVTDIPRAYDTTRLYEALKNAVWSLCGSPKVKVHKRGRRLFLVVKDPLKFY